MAFPPFCFFLLFSSFSSIVFSQQPSELSVDYYAKTCPQFDEIVHTAAVTKQMQIPTTAPALLRTFFHDCMVEGCDASVLISSNAFNTAERDNEINHSLPGDAFELITRIKTALELACPKVVSCADILAFTTRALITQTGGPMYTVKLGRKDSLISQALHVEGHLARTNMTLDQIIPSFEAKGLTIQEMVALTGGGHTFGFAHCKEFSDRIFGPKVDPTIHPVFAARLKIICANYTVNTAQSAFLDPITSGIFDNMYFKNLLRGLGLLATDAALVADPRTRPWVEKYANKQELFFKDFAAAMEKTSQIGVKTGSQGEVRQRCDAFNTVKP